MSEAKFTKGAWMVSMIGGRYRALIESEDTGYCIADIFDITDKDMANAHLITAAPEMYQMLESVREDYGLLTDVGKAIDKLLAKARGEL